MTAETLQTATAWLSSRPVDVERERRRRYVESSPTGSMTHHHRGGKNITPSRSRTQLKFSPYILDAVVIGAAQVPELL
jgi:hypothetical protein